MAENLLMVVPYWGDDTPRELFSYRGPRQRHIDLLKANGVSIWAMVRPDPIRLAIGERTSLDYFVEVGEGEEWIAFGAPGDIVYWHPETGRLATARNRAFALGEELIGNAFTYAMDQSLRIFTDPFDWLRHGRKGIVVLKWQWAFDRLRHCSSIAVPESLLDVYLQHMQPSPLPRLLVIPEGRAAA
jgi:hypothetical protein